MRYDFSVKGMHCSACKTLVEEALEENGGKDIVIVIDGEPLTWKAAKLEIEQETEKGRGILQELVILKLLHDE